MTRDWSIRGITRRLLPVLLVLTVLELGSGLVLATLEGQLLRYPSLLALVPVTIGTAGNLGSVLSARLSTVFHLGLLSFDVHDDHLAGNVVATVALAVTVFPLVGAGTWALTRFVATVRLSVGTVVGVALASGAVLAVLTVVVTILATWISYRLETDPDDVVIPVVTNVCDVLGVVVLFVVVRRVVP